MLRDVTVAVAVVVLTVATAPPGAAAPLPWAPAPVNACGETGFDPQARTPNPDAAPPRPAPAQPPTIQVQVLQPKITPVKIPKQLHNTRIAPAALPADLCANPCPQLAGGRTRTSYPIPPGTPTWPEGPPKPTTTTAPPTTTPTTTPPPTGTTPPTPWQLPKVQFVPHPETIPLPVTLLGPDVTGPRPQPIPPVVHPPVQPAPVTRPLAPFQIRDVYPVSQLTGPGSQNRTDVRWQVDDTDLGLMWESAPGRIAVAFGDTFGTGFRDGGPSGGDWRSNVIGFSSDHDLAHGMKIDNMVSDAPCHATEVLGSYKVNNFEITVIPTSGFALGDRQYLSYMSVARWSEKPSRWWTNYGGLAYSDDGGQTWVDNEHARWDNVFGQGQFQVVAMAPHDGYVYMFGTPNGRFGTIALARVPQADVLNKTAYQYWIDGFWRPTLQPPTPGGSGMELSASPIMSGIAGEVSVRYDTAADRWEMSYLDADNNVLVMRRSTTPQGIWSAPATLLHTEDYPSGYGGFIHPWSTGNDLYFTLSEWRHYNVYLMHASIH
ncbi:DUF4185 domain-containing protein [Nocardia vaccinii]|uniref:DUF4185 domain-containing protein n=1 Tax=Nocardia vaccinii TaxID=1822 RepID=UPI000835C3CF|nr:DUF4185 domain-containing protein [Nocardia vaccinii]